MGGRERRGLCLDDEHCREVIVELVVAVDPGLNPTQVRRVVEAVAPASRGRRLILAELDEHPDVLTNGSTRSGRATQVFIRELVRAGSTALVAPRCELCGSTKPTVRRLQSGGGACRSCARWMTLTRCSGCGQVRPRGSRRQDGRPLCEWCTDLSRVSSCDRCGQPATPRHQGGRGICLCLACAHRSASEQWDCSRCQGFARLSGAPRVRPPRPPRPHRRPEEGRCDRCERMMPILSRRTGEALCAVCYRAPQQLCGTSCHPRRHSERLLSCLVCQDTSTHTCPTCNGTSFTFNAAAPGGFRCERCTLNAMMLEVLQDSNGAVNPHLLGFVEALSAVESPGTAIQWLRRGRARDLLVAMARGEMDLSHEALDEVGGDIPGRANGVEHLRQLLVSSGALPARDEYLSRLERIISGLLEQAHSEDAKVLRRYARFQVLAGARRRIDRGGASAAVSQSAIHKFRVACRFMVWLRANGIDRMDIPQSAMDQWLVEQKGRRRELAVFLRWAARTRLTSRVHLDPEITRDPTAFIPEQTHWELTRRLLHEEALPATDRLAGCLILMYGQPLRRLLRLRHSDIRITAGNTSIMLGSEAVVLVEPLGRIAADLIAGRVRDETVHGIAQSFPQQQDWLFPGRRAGQPIGEKALNRRLRKRGIAVRGARNTALLALARSVPPAVLADLLGILPETAERWRDLAGGSWTQYAAVRGYSKQIPS